MSIELLTCILITIAALVYVFYLPGKLYMGPEKTRVIYLSERKEAIYENLRDLVRVEVGDEVQDRRERQRQQHPVLPTKGTTDEHQQQGKKRKQERGLECVSHISSHRIRWCAGPGDSSADSDGRGRPSSINLSRL